MKWLFYRREREITMEELLKLALEEYFETNKDTYAYWLTRDKSAFDAGTMTLDDFEEFDDTTINDIAENVTQYIINYCGNINKQEEVLEIISLLTGRYR